MNASVLLTNLRAADVHIERRGDQLVIDAPPSVVTDERLAEIRSHKADILRLLPEEPSQVQIEDDTEESADRYFENVILNYLCDRIATHGEIMTFLYGAGASDNEARSAIRRLQESGLIGHNLTTGYVLGHLIGRSPAGVRKARRK